MDKAMNHLAKLSNGLRELEYDARLHELAVTGLPTILEEAQLPPEDFIESLKRSASALTAQIAKLTEYVDQVDPKELTAA